MDYTTLRKQSLSRRQEITQRLKKISEQRMLLQTEAEQNQRELAAIDHILESLDSLNSGEPLAGEPSGMADHIRRLLQQSPVHLLPTQIRDSLINSGITGSSPKNLLIGVHNVLSRLELFLETTDVNNRAAYRWKRETAKETMSGARLRKAKV